MSTGTAHLRLEKVAEYEWDPANVFLVVTENRIAICNEKDDEIMALSPKDVTFEAFRGMCIEVTMFNIWVGLPGSGHAAFRFPRNFKGKIKIE